MTPLKNNGLCCKCGENPRHNTWLCKACNSAFQKEIHRKRYSTPESKSFWQSKAREYRENNKEKLCRQRREWAKRNPKRNAELAKKSYLKNVELIRPRLQRQRWNLSEEQHSRLFKNQNGVCAICKEACKTRKILAIDHDHSNGMMRGLLCMRCNTGLGYFRDNTDLLSEAIDYLNAYQCQKAIA